MSTMPPRKGQPGRARRRYGRLASYRQFTPLPEGEMDGAQAVRHHLRWLLSNMDWFAAQGRGALASASVALHRDLAHLGYVAPAPKSAAELAELLRPPSAEEIAALVQPPSAQQVAEQVAKLHQQQGAACGELSNALHVLHQWFHYNKEVWYDASGRDYHRQVREGMMRALELLGHEWRSAKN